MRHTTSAAALAALAAALTLAACAALTGVDSLPDRHPEALGKGRPVCTDCHDPEEGPIAYADFVHDPDWADTHRHRAAQQERVCALCHRESFCNQCHVTRGELKPSQRVPTDTYRRTPHRGDYLSRHRLDARLDPTSCFRCHGNPKSAKTCAPCHG